MLPRYITRLRLQGRGGGQIAPHRAIRRVRVSAVDVVMHGALTAAITIAWLAVFPLVAELWRSVFLYWQRPLRLPGMVASWTLRVGPIHAAIPYFSAIAPAPSETIWIATLVACGLALLAAGRLPDRYLPLAYFLRAVVFIQATALLYFRFATGDASMLADYTRLMLSAGILFLSLVPLLYAATYYIIDVAIWRKAALTLITMAHLIVMLPLQYLVQAYVLHRLSLLFLPLFFILFGLFVQIMVYVAFYGWGMSWPGRADRADRWAPAS